MVWSVEYDPEALRDLKKLDRTIQREILDYMDERIAKASRPRNFGKLCDIANMASGSVESVITASSVNCKTHAW